MIGRLHVRIALAFLGLLLATFVVVGGTVAVLAPDERDERDWGAVVEVVVDSLPPRDDPGFAARLEVLGAKLGADLTLRDPGGALVGAAGAELPDGRAGWFREGRRHGVRIVLSDGRRVAYSPRDRGRLGPLWLAVLAAFVGVLALGTWPVARGLTRRLDAVRGAVERWGEGALDARAPVVGRDELARVAETFNAAADRVQALVEADRRTLASVSHELRSPLARLRMALELLRDDGATRARLLDEAERDVDELDATVAELLQVGRLQARGLAAREPVDVDALVAEEAGGAEVHGAAGVVQGDPRLLRRLVRNLLDNAARHGRPPVEITLAAGRLAVADRGPGVPEAERERVFEAFHRAAGHAEGRDGGVGLGLWLVREIARAHGGEVRCLPREGGGTVFEVTLPT